ncbi:hypothetical protein SLA2020_356500 [Shorea laevis]
MAARGCNGLFRRRNLFHRSSHRHRQLSFRRFGLSEDFNISTNTSSLLSPLNLFAPALQSPLYLLAPASTHCCPHPAFFNQHPRHCKLTVHMPQPLTFPLQKASNLCLSSLPEQGSFPLVYLHQQEPSVLIRASLSDDTAETSFGTSPKIYGTSS